MALLRREVAAPRPEAAPRLLVVSRPLAVPRPPVGLLAVRRSTWPPSAVTRRSMRSAPSRSGAGCRRRERAASPTTSESCSSTASPGAGTRCPPFEMAAWRSTRREPRSVTQTSRASTAAALGTPHPAAARRFSRACSSAAAASARNALRGGATPRRRALASASRSPMRASWLAIRRGAETSRASSRCRALVSSGAASRARSWGNRATPTLRTCARRPCRAMA